MTLTPLEKAQKALAKIVESAKANASNGYTVSVFLGKYIICEYCYKVFLKEYRLAKGKDATSGKLNINVSEISKVMEFANIEMDDTVINAVFLAMILKDNVPAEN